MVLQQLAPPMTARPLPAAVHALPAALHPGAMHPSGVSLVSASVSASVREWITDTNNQQNLHQTLKHALPRPEHALPRPEHALPRPEHALPRPDMSSLPGLHPHGNVQQRASPTTHGNAQQRASITPHCNAQTADSTTCVAGQVSPARDITDNARGAQHTATSPACSSALPTTHAALPTTRTKDSAALPPAHKPDSVSSLPTHADSALHRMPAVTDSGALCLARGGITDSLSRDHVSPRPYVIVPDHSQNPGGPPAEQHTPHHPLVTMLNIPSLCTSSSSPTKNKQVNDDTGKSLPIRCVVEQYTTSSTGTPVNGERPQQPTLRETDTYAILPANTPFCEIVRTALVKIGYAAPEAMGAKGTIQLKSWKPLTFDAITENPDSTVEDILGDLTSVATLRIRLSSQSKWVAVEEMKEKLLNFLLQHSQGVLTNAGCPVEKPMLAQLTQGMSNSLPEETRDAFNKWYKDQTQRTPTRTPQMTSPFPCNGTSDVTSESPSDLSMTPSSSAGVSVKSETLSPMSAFSLARTRMRTSFDPEHEIPRLQKWFSHNQHPTRDQMTLYLKELNQLDSRHGRKPLDLTNIIYWFKNARAAQRRVHKSLDNSSDNDGSAMLEVDENENETLRSGMGLQEIPETLRSGMGLQEIPEALRSGMGLQEIPEALRSGMGLQEIPEALRSGMGMPEQQAPTTTAQPTTTPTVSDSVEVPELPNRNAVYVVQPLPTEEMDEVVRIREEDMEDPADKSSIPSQDVVQLKEESSPSEKPDHKTDATDATPEMNATPKASSPLDQEQATDLSMRSRRDSSDSGTARDVHSVSDDHVTDSHPLAVNNLSLSLKRKRMEEDEEGYMSSSAGGSPSPPAPTGLLPAVPSPITPGLPHQPQHHPMQLQQVQQHALQMAAMSHALNMHYMHPGNMYSPASMVSPSPYKDLGPSNPGQTSPGGMSDSSAEKKKRSRVFIDPLSEIPKLEKWFLEDTHPSSYMIEKYTEELNRSTYRQRFPRLEPKNVQLWFKNHRAKVKRARLETIANGAM